MCFTYLFIHFVLFFFIGILLCVQKLYTQLTGIHVLFDWKVETQRKQNLFKNTLLVCGLCTNTIPPNCQYYISTFSFSSLTSHNIYRWASSRCNSHLCLNWSSPVWAVSTIPIFPLCKNCCFSLLHLIKVNKMPVILRFL